ncbi:MAG: response regulator transcription factor [Chitinophagaceae bacterium]|nr:response regulator transcription factor [Chitinophagaceae bacterium]
MIHVAITDDQQIILNGLQKIIAEAGDIQLTGIFTNGDDLLEALPEANPDVILLDIYMPGKNGIELAGIISKEYPSIKIIALTNVDIIPQVKKMLQQGASGYLLKDAAPEIIIDAIRKVADGEKYLYNDLQKQIMNNLFEPKSSHVITRREKEILQLIVDEHTNQEIADKLFLSLRTVENHRNNLLQKLGVKNTAGLVKAAISQGLV